MQSEGIEKTVVIVREKLRLFFDIMFVEGMPFLVSKCNPLGLRQVTDLAGKRHSTMLIKGFDEPRATIVNKGYDIKEVLADGESGLVRIKDYIERLAIR